jgi:hypothetical protein
MPLLCFTNSRKKIRSGFQSAGISSTTRSASACDFAETTPDIPNRSTQHSGD